MIGPGDILPNAAKKFADKIALVCGSESFTFGELNRMSDSLACEIAKLGVQPGEAVSLFSQNRWEWLVTYHGILKAGAVVNPINVMLTQDELAFILVDRRAKRTPLAG
ncbi:AMP-binding protein [Sphingopyxis sp.]|uniref:AMP-binding protein n=1 Tax=Sphingopyxis sp. TaxID=1908224 RepID=UPI0025FD4E07|nr:AMP-binding protein [Sphingopyxis sp.]MBK6411589.1 AMP-binding protein [Sphingopyxis sp.]